MIRRLTIVHSRKFPNEKDLNEELQWLGTSLGLFNLRDKDSSCFRVFITLIRKTRRNEPLSSDSIAERLNLSRGTVIHHLNRLMESGIVIKEKEGYLLREHNLSKVIKDMHEDMERAFSELKEIAEEIDEKLG